MGRWNSNTQTYDFTTGLGGSKFANGSITGLVVDPTTTKPNEKVYVALSSGMATGPSDGSVTTTPSGAYGIWRSLNSGSTWSLVLPAPSNLKGTDLEMDTTTNPPTLYAGLQSAGFYKSIDGGSNWTAKNTGINPALLTGCVSNCTPSDWAEIVIAPSQPSTLYAAMGQCPHPFTFGNMTTYFCKPAIYQSIDSGNNWTEKAPFVPASMLHYRTAYDSERSAYFTYQHKLIVNPTDPTLLYFTGTMFNLSNGDSGSDPWQPRSKLHPDHHDLALYMVGSDMLAYEANDGGLFTGDGYDAWDDGAQFGLQVTQLQSLTAVPGKPGLLLQGTQDNGTNVNVYATLWGHHDDGDSSSAFVDVDDPATSYDTFVKFDRSPRRCQSFLVCTDEDKNPFSWPKASIGLGLTDPVAWYPPMVQGGILPGQTKHALFIASSKLYTSSNQADAWLPAGALSPAEHTFVFPTINSTNVITAIAVAPSNPQHVYVGYYNGEVWASTNVTWNGQGTTWTQNRSGGTTAVPISSIAVDPANENVVYVGFTQRTGPLIRTTNGGGSWNNWYSGLVGTHVNAVAVLNDAAGQYVFAGTDDGVYVRGPGDNSMHKLANGLPAVSVYSIVVDDVNGKLYAGTHGRGVWALDFSVTPLLIPEVFHCLACDLFGPDPVSGPVNLALSGAMFPPSQPSCSVTLYQGLTACATGTTDGDGATMHTDATGRLVTDKTGAYTNKPLAWGCFGGKCLGGTGLSPCMSAPVTRAAITCGSMSGSVTVPSPTAKLNPPSAVFTITPDTNPINPPYTLTLAARSRDSTGAVATLCTVSVAGIPPGLPSDQIISQLATAMNTSAACVTAGVSAQASAEGEPGADERVMRGPALTLSAPGLTARQIFPEVSSQTYGTLALEQLGRPTDEQIESPMFTVAVPAGAGAAGGSITIEERGPFGHCAYTVTTNPGDTAATISAHAAASFNSSSNDGSCRDVQKARDVLVANPTTNASKMVFSAASGIAVKSSDANVTVTVGPAGW